jgi:hypothetical protein
MRETVGRILFHPLAAPVLVAVLILDLRSQVPPRGYSGGSTMRAMYWGTGESGPPPAGCTRQAVLDDGLWNFVDMSRRRSSSGHGDPKRGDLFSRADLASAVTFRPSDTASGFWAVTRLQRERRVDVDRSLPSADQTSMRTAFVHTIVQFVFPMTPREESRLEQENFTETCVVWSGYVHNAAAILMLAWLPFACHGTWRFARDLGPNRRRRRGLCVACGYDLAGVRERCPECGTEGLPAPPR